MPIPSSINDLSTTASLNSPAGSESPGVLDDYQRAHASFIAGLRDKTSNIDNTSDANKPVSTATQTALNAKFDKAGGTITGPATISGSAVNLTLKSSSSSGNNYIQFLNSAGLSTGYFGLGGTSDNNLTYFIPGLNDHIFYNNGLLTAKFDANRFLLIGYASSNGAYSLQVNSQIFATSSTVATSDGRYKENVTTLANALPLVRALRPVHFNWKPHPVHKFHEDVQLGFIAQEVQQALTGMPYLESLVKANTCTITPEQKDPETGEIARPAVTEEFLGIAEGNMIALLTAAIQELSARVEALESAA